MKELKQAEQIRTWVQSILTDESSGHDWHHVSRVADLAAYIGEKEKADLFIVETAALVHDLIDVKLPDTVRLSVNEVYDQLVFFGVGKENADRVIHIITRMSFRDREKLAKEPLSIEEKPYRMLTDLMRLVLSALRELSCLRAQKGMAFMEMSKAPTLIFFKSCCG